MNKILLLPLVLSIFACSHTIDLDEQALQLVELTSEPKICKYQYEINSNVSVYNKEDAKRYLLNQIIKINQTKEEKSNAYMITNSEETENIDAFFSPSKTYSYQAKIYSCPQHKMDIIISAPENSLKLRK